MIALLGGSVATLFAKYASEHPEHFEPLRSALPELGDKRIVVANLALGGRRQPQQYFIAAFFLDDVDLFIRTPGKQAFVFLQPNQYLKASKGFSELEKATAVDPAKYGFIHAPMQRFKEEFRALNEKGVRAHDLTGIFEGTDDTRLY